MSENLFEVKLDEFEGPLDLLLTLIQENKIDIFNIPIAFITEKYLERIAVMQELDLNFSGEFLVMAATLIYIKSKMLLPVEENDDEENDEGVDPRDELVKKLLEYQSFKKVAEELGFLAKERSKVYTRPESIKNNQKIEIENTDEFKADLYSLIQAFSVLLQKQKKEVAHEVFEEVISIEEKMDDIKEIINTKDKVAFSELFKETHSKNVLIASFFAILELAKQKFLRIVQTDIFGEILLEKNYISVGV